MKKLGSWIKEVVYLISGFTEILVSVLITGAVLFMLAGLIKELFLRPVSFMEIEGFNEFLGAALSLVVGIEFVNLLCKHTAETLIEVLMFAIARQVIVEHLDTMQTLIGIISIVILFAARKYLLLGEKDERHRKDEL